MDKARKYTFLFKKKKKSQVYVSISNSHVTLQEFLFDFFGFTLEYHSHMLKMLKTRSVFDFDYPDVIGYIGLSCVYRKY